MLRLDRAGQDQREAAEPAPEALDNVPIAAYSTTTYLARSAVRLQL